jgi:hypothetical protein
LVNDLRKRLAAGAIAVLVIALAEPGWAAVKIPVPRAKPDLQAVLIPIPKPKPARKLKSKVAWPKAVGKWDSGEVVDARRSCERILSGLDIIWRPDEPIGREGACGTAAPIAISEVAQVRIDPPATVNCDFAKALHDWFAHDLKSAARKQLRSEILAVRNASSYACRLRNNGRTGKLSEHGRANALDISGFVFAKKGEVEVAGGSSGLLQSIGFSGKGSFLKSARKSACKYFNTVLGPGADRHHGDHFHVDLMKLRPGRFKMCR